MTSLAEMEVKNHQRTFKSRCRSYDMGEIQTKEGPDGRFYNIDGEYYPSVTTVLGKTKSESEGLQKWIDSVGEYEADIIKRKAATRGNILHDLADSYLKGEAIYYNKLDPISRNNFLNMLPVLNQIEEIYIQEQVLYSKELKLAGRCDLIAGLIDNKLVVIDFKGSSKKKKIEYIENYFLQVTAYYLMAKELFDIKADYGLILISVSGSPEVDKYEVDFSQYESKLKELISEYRNQEKMNNV